MTGLYPSAAQFELFQFFNDFNISKSLLIKFWNYCYPEESDIMVPQLNDAYVVQKTFGSIEQFRIQFEEFVFSQYPNSKLSSEIRRINDIYSSSNGTKGRTPLHKMIQMFNSCKLFDKDVFFMCRNEDKLEIAKLIAEIPLSFEDR